jgi:hypothetical protein
MEEFSSSVVAPTARDLAAMMEKVKVKLDSFNEHLDHSIISAQMLHAEDLLEEMSNAKEKVEDILDYSKAFDKAMSKTFWGVSANNILAGVNKLFGWIVKKAKKKIAKLVGKIKKPAFIDDVVEDAANSLVGEEKIERFKNFKAKELMPEELSSAKEMNKALGINFQNLNRLNLNFTYGQNIDAGCLEISELLVDMGYDVSEPTHPDPEVEKEFEEKSGTIIDDVKQWSPEMIAEKLLDIGVSLSVTAKEYAEDGFKAFEDVSECFSLKFSEAVECFGLDRKYIDQLIEWADKSAAPVVTTSMIAVGVAGAVTAALW